MNKQKYQYIVRYTGEIGTKQRQVRWRFINRLGMNIKKGIVRQFGKSVLEDSTVDARWSYTFVASPVDLEELLRAVPGIQHFSPVEVTEDLKFESLVKTAHERFKEQVEKLETYGVRCRIREDVDYDKRAVEQEVGARLNDKGEVDLDNPDIFCYIELREGRAFLYDRKIPGMKGVPIGVQQKSLTLLSGGIDSPIATWLSYRAGIDQDFIYFDLGGEEQKENIFQVYETLVKKWGAGATSRLIVIDYLPVVAEIRQTVKSSYQNLVLKYCFYKSAEQLAGEETRALITGESVGQVSTQTIPNLAALDQTTELLLVRPLTTYTKEEIMSLAREIETFEMAYKGKEYCALATRNVVTASSYDRLMEVVQSLDESVIEQVIEQRNVYQIDGAGELKQVREGSSRETSSTEPERETKTSFEKKISRADRVIDLRSADDYQQNPLDGAENIPFDEAWNDYIHWEEEKRYLLVCEVGSRSKMLAHYMAEDGFDVEHFEGGLQQLQQERLSSGKG